MNSVSLRTSRLYFSGRLADLVLLADHRGEDLVPLAHVRLVVEVQVFSGVPPGPGDRVLGLALGAEDGRQDGDRQDAEDHAQGDCRC